MSIKINHRNLTIPNSGHNPQMPFPMEVNPLWWSIRPIVGPRCSNMISSNVANPIMVEKASAMDTPPPTIYISPRAYLRSIWAIIKSAFLHPFSTTIVDLSTGESTEVPPMDRS